MESKELNIGSASAPSYEEAMKCASVPPNQMHPYPSHTMQAMPQHQYQPQQMMPPAQAPAPPVQQQPSVVNPIVQTFNIGGGIGLPPTCHSCSKPLHTRVCYVSTCSTHLCFLLCCIFVCWPCAPFVYCTKTCREPRLQCVSCGARV